MEKKYDIIGLATPGQDLVIELEKMPPEVSRKMYDCFFKGGGWVENAPREISVCGHPFAALLETMFSAE